MSPTRAVITLTAALSCAAISSAQNTNRVSAWPLDAGWTRDFPFGDALSLALGSSRLLVADPTQVAAHAWSDAGLVWVSLLDATVPPLVHDGRVFIAAEEQIHALSEDNGKVEWRLPSGRVSITPTARAGWLIVADDNGTLRGVDASSGRVVWQNELKVSLATSPVIDGDLVVAALADGRVTASQIKDGTLRWTTPVGTRPTQSLAAGGRVFVTGEDGRLIALRQRDGRQEWAYDLKMDVVGRLAADAKHVYVTTLDNSVRAHAFNGHQRWRKEVASRIVDGLLVDSDRVFVPQSDGTIQIYTADGARAGRLSTPAKQTSVLGAMVAAGSGNGLRMALTTSAGSRLTVVTYKPTGLPVTVASVPPPGAVLPLSAPPRT